MIKLGFKRVHALLFVGLATIFSATYTVHEWSWVYRDKCSQEKIKKNKQAQYVFEKVSIPEFSQLICSWNALRPAKGYYAFFVQARDANTKKWGKWHHMADWGVNVQRSHLSKSDGVTSYHHVRLQTDNNNYCDGFRIKAIGLNGAWVGRVKNIAVSATNYQKFKREQLATAVAGLASVHIKGVPKISQRAVKHPERHRICSPTSCSMVTRFLMGRAFNTVDFVDNVFDTGLDAYGSWPFNMAHAFERTNGNVNFFVRRLNDFSTLHTQLRSGMPVIVSVRGKMSGAQSAYKNGHLLVVVGWDAQKREVLVHDPAFKPHNGIFKRYKIGDFLRAWEASKRLVYWVERSAKTLV